MVLLIVGGASWKRGQLSGVRLLLSGIALNSICSAFILLTNSVVRDRRSISITQWLLGSVDSASYKAVGKPSAAEKMAFDALLESSGVTDDQKTDIYSEVE